MDDKSRALFDKACQLIPGGVNSPVRACHNVDSLPLFIAEAHGSHIIDVDGREYIDFILSWGPMILGHDHPAVTAAVREAAGRGTSYGAPCPDEVTLAEEVVADMPSLEMVRMVNSGTEATMSALRLARGVTGRDKVLKFIGLVMWAFALSCGGLWMLAGLLDNMNLFYAGIVATLAVAIFTLVYMNTGRRFLKK